jgi:hypothetical protein
MDEENIVRYTSEQLRNLPDTETDWARVNAMTDEEIERNALEDPDAPPVTEQQLKNAVWVIPDKEVRTTNGQ